MKHIKKFNEDLSNVGWEVIKPTEWNELVDKYDANVLPEMTEDEN